MPQIVLILFVILTIFVSETAGSDGPVSSERQPSDVIKAVKEEDEDDDHDEDVDSTASVAAPSAPSSMDKKVAEDLRTPATILKDFVNPLRNNPTAELSQSSMLQLHKVADSLWKLRLGYLKKVKAIRERLNEYSQGRSIEISNIDKEFKGENSDPRLVAILSHTQLELLALIDRLERLAYMAESEIIEVYPTEPLSEVTLDPYADAPKKYAEERYDQLEIDGHSIAGMRSLHKALNFLQDVLIRLIQGSGCAATASRLIKTPSSASVGDLQVLHWCEKTRKWRFTSSVAVQDEDILEEISAIEYAHNTGAVPLRGLPPTRRASTKPVSECGPKCKEDTFHHEPLFISTFEDRETSVHFGAVLGCMWNAAQRRFHGVKLQFIPSWDLACTEEGKSCPGTLKSSDAVCKSLQRQVELCRSGSQRSAGNAACIAAAVYSVTN